jgi:uncharacterized membrane protein YphA (DoxX/SURF4 family)
MYNKYMKYLFFTFSYFLLFTKSAVAHVGYVIEKEKFDIAKGSDASFLKQAMFNSENIKLAVIVILSFFLLYYLVHKIEFTHKIITKAKDKLNSYKDLIPWIARICLGIALMGASTAGVLISPVMANDFGLGWLELLLGFFLLLGAFITPVVVVSIALFFVGLNSNFYLLGNLEFPALLFILLILGNGRPGFDDVFGIKILQIEKLKKFVPLIARLGIGIAMLFLAIYEKLLNPHLSELVVQKYNLTELIHVSPSMWVLGAGIVELLIGVFLIIGFKTRLTSAIAFLVLILTFFGLQEEVFSHITLFGTLSILMITGGGFLSIDEKKTIS